VVPLRQFDLTRILVAILPGRTAAAAAAWNPTAIDSSERQGKELTRTAQHNRTVLNRRVIGPGPIVGGSSSFDPQQVRAFIFPTTSDGVDLCLFGCSGGFSRPRPSSENIFGDEFSATAGMGIGGGVDVSVNERWNLRGQIDFLRPFEENSDWARRIFLGVSTRIGG
jgi:hypothetical protein